MPPKGSTAAKKPKGSTSTDKKPAVKEQPSTPEPQVKDENDVKSTPNKSATKKTRRPAKEQPKPFNPLGNTIGDTAPIDISYENETENGKLLGDFGGYGQDLRLRAAQPFKLVTSIMMTEGPYAGHQAILVAPSAPFPFLLLPELVRVRVYGHYFAPEGKANGKIEISQSPNGLIAKCYSGPKGTSRLGLLGVNKEILAGARPVLYSFTLKFDKTDTVLAFLTCVGEKVRSLLVSLDITSYIKATAMPMMTMLSECKNIQRIHIAGGVGSGSNPEKAAKQFYSDASRFLQVVGNLRGDKHAGIELLTFGKACFTNKVDGDYEQWDDDEVDDFTDALRAKLK